MQHALRGPAANGRMMAIEPFKREMVRWFENVPHLKTRNQQQPESVSFWLGQKCDLALQALLGDAAYFGWVVQSVLTIGSRDLAQIIFLAGAVLCLTRNVHAFSVMGRAACAKYPTQPDMFSYIIVIYVSLSPRNQQPGQIHVQN